jgi:DNA-binding transcriptional LysR family regulator
MNLNQLRFAKAVAETGSFSRAAEHCFVTQPTLSNAIGQLEDDLGGRIFRRTTRNVSVTPFGRHVLPLIDAVLDAQSELLIAAKAFHEPVHRLIRIGFSPLVDVRLFSQLLAPYTASHPDVEVFFKQCFLRDMEARLDSGTVDLAIVPGGMRPGGRQSLRLYSEPLYFLPRECDGAPVPAPGPCRLRDYAAEAIILTNGCGLSDVIAEMYRKEGLGLKAYPGQALSYQVVEDWAGLGIGAGILPRSKISGANRAAHSIALHDGASAEVVYEAQWNAEAIRMPHLAQLVAHLRQAAASGAEQLLMPRPADAGQGGGVDAGVSSSPVGTG